MIAYSLYVVTMSKVYYNVTLPSVQCKLNKHKIYTQHSYFF